MRAGPIRKIRHPRYPTKIEIRSDPDLLEKHVPKAWLSRGQIAGAAALVLGSATLLANTGCITQGCVVILPPVYISEEQAIEIIKEELASRGVTVSDSSTDTMDLPIVVDLADPDTNVAIEFVSYDQCVEVTGDVGTDEYPRCDVHAVASLLVSEVHDSESDVHFEAIPDPSRNSEEDSYESLREQVQEFADWLASQGVI